MGKRGQEDGESQRGWMAQGRSVLQAQQNRGTRELTETVEECTGPVQAQVRWESQ